MLKNTGDEALQWNAINHKQKSQMGYQYNKKNPISIIISHTYIHSKQASRTFSLSYNKFLSLMCSCSSQRFWTNKKSYKVGVMWKEGWENNLQQQQRRRRREKNNKIIFIKWDESFNNIINASLLARWNFYLWNEWHGISPRTKNFYNFIKLSFLLDTRMI